ncbi:MAG: NAD(P)H-dependent glycerol-3-phosphate dehydrogenase [candidate division Zixibacteria bacterium CG_4_9_14_3_um_filter_46_8]|nr:MAG: NAD(P)H-dependent glycerol-3-phosphate dehydrogenase [candidate division Zixibacteria bacterium CG_4_9_14_3_um_filter_46_8]
MSKISDDLKIAVLGGGSWGIAFSVHLCICGHKVRIWEFNKADAALLAGTRQHQGKLPGIIIPREIRIENDLHSVLDGVRIIAMAIPSHTVRQVVRSLRGDLNREVLIINLAKGLETDTLMRMSQVIIEELGDEFRNNVMTLSGPSHAEEVSRQIPTTVTVAGDSIENLEYVQRLFTSNYFRLYTNTDLVGVELAGSLKNIIAIAAGICDGLGYGDNTKGALLTRGLAEITRLGLAMGAVPDTFAGLAGLGDLITTCLSRHSRNRFVGEQIGLGKNLEQVLHEMTMVAEGVRTTQAAYKLANMYQVEMPITIEMYSILFGGKSPREAVNDLMTRIPKPEVG